MLLADGDHQPALADLVANLPDLPIRQPCRAIERSVRGCHSRILPVVASLALIALWPSPRPNPTTWGLLALSRSLSLARLGRIRSSPAAAAGNIGIGRG